MRKIILLMLLLLVLGTPLHAQNDAPVDILFWHHYADDERAAFWQQMADTFNAQQVDVRVTVQFFPAYANQHDAILGALVNGGLPDVALIRPDDAALYQLSDALVDFAPYLENGTLNPQDFDPVIWQQDTHDEFGNAQLGIPLSRAATALYINMDLLVQAGYQAPPQTLSELGEMACAFAGIGFDVPLDASWLLATSQPAAFFVDGAFDFDQNGLRETISFLQTMLSQGCAALTLGDVAAPQTRFASGQTLFYVASSGAQRFIENAIGQFYAQPFPLRMVPLPAQDAPVTHLTGVSLSAFRSTPEREDAAWQWVAWLAQAQNARAWADVNQAIPARLDVESSDWQAFQSATVFTEPVFAGYPLIRDELVFAVRGILAGEDINRRLAQLTEDANRIYQVFVLE